jgi:hypothetical protein
MRAQGGLGADSCAHRVWAYTKRPLVPAGLDRRDQGCCGAQANGTGQGHLRRYVALATPATRPAHRICVGSLPYVPQWPFPPLSGRSCHAGTATCAATTRACVYTFTRVCTSHQPPVLLPPPARGEIQVLLACRVCPPSPRCVSYPMSADGPCEGLTSRSTATSTTTRSCSCRTTVKYTVRGLAIHNEPLVDALL